MVEPSVFQKGQSGFKKITPFYDPKAIDRKLNSLNLNAGDVGGMLAAVIRAGINTPQQKATQSSLRNNANTALLNFEKCVMDISRKLNKPEGVSALISLANSIRADLKKNNISNNTLNHLYDLHEAVLNYRDSIPSANKKVSSYKEVLTEHQWTAFSMVSLTIASTNGKGVPDIPVSEIVKAANFIKQNDKDIVVVAGPFGERSRRPDETGYPAGTRYAVISKEDFRYSIGRHAQRK